jgi:hypothetical protein
MLGNSHVRFWRPSPGATPAMSLTYTHIFRAVYATIAAHWYCPPSVPEHQFKAEIQGHFSITQEGKRLPNYSARSKL